jgi:hypothetical protein
VNDSVGVQIDQGFDCLLNVRGRFTLAEESFLTKTVEKRSRTQLDHQIEVISFFVAFIELEDVLMLSERLNLNLVNQPFN